MSNTPIQTVHEILRSLDLGQFEKLDEDMTARGVENERQAIAIMENEGFEIGPEIRAINEFVRKNRLSEDAAGEVGVIVFSKLNNLDLKAAAGRA